MKATLTLETRDAKEAVALAAALTPDNGSHASCKAVRAAVVVEVQADSTMGLLRSLDDVLECARATGLV